MSESNYTDPDRMYEERYEPAERSMDEDFVDEKEDGNELDEDLDLDTDEDYEAEHDGQPDEAQEWNDFDSDC